MSAEYWETHYCSITDVTLLMGEQLMNTKRIEKQIPRAAGWKILLFLVVLIVGLNVVVFYLVFRRSRLEVQSDPVPHYFATIAQAKPLPKTLDPAQFSNRYVAAAYRSAKEIPEVLTLQPCYCHCDRSRGHRSLLDCFADRHGSECDICVREALFALQEHRKGKSADEIRTEIAQGKWKSIQVE